MEQLGLLDTGERQDYQIEKKTMVRLGRHSAQVSLKKKRREAAERLKEILAQLQGKDILVSQYCDFWWYNALRLSRLKVSWLGFRQLPDVIVLWGTRGQNIRIFLDHLYNIRTQYYGNNKAYYLLDFWNGYQESLGGKYERRGYDCLQIEAAK
ncbi:MAG: hypothetical protein U9R04_03310 [Chloroflexota bacterium]|nr:hypothetical protein [Chloroflexota bacterium]